MIDKLLLPLLKLTALFWLLNLERVIGLPWLSILLTLVWLRGLNLGQKFFLLSWQVILMAVIYQLSFSLMAVLIIGAEIAVLLLNHWTKVRWWGLLSLSWLGVILMTVLSHYSWSLNDWFALLASWLGLILAARYLAQRKDLIWQMKYHA